MGACKLPEREGEQKAGAEAMKRSLMSFVTFFVTSRKWLIIMLLIPAICSCRSVKYVPVETVKTDSIYISNVLRDSIYRLDSIYIRDKGDTVWVEKYKYLFVDKLRHDTLYLSRTDSIRVPYPVEKELTRWQQMKLELGGWAFGIIIAFALIIVGWLIYKSRKK